jgi:hypothetical protein
MLDIDLVYAEGRLVIKRITQGGLCVICERQANYSLLNLTLEQGLGVLRSAESILSIEDNSKIIEGLKDIAKEILGDYATKVIPILDSAGSTEDELEKAIQQAEKITRMFISQDQAGKMAERMRALVQQGS